MGEGAGGVHSLDSDGRGEESGERVGIKVIRCNYLFPHPFVPLVGNSAKDNTAMYR